MRRALRMPALFALVAMLLAQAALAGSCLAERPPSAASALAQVADAGEAPCHEPSAEAACFAHCVASEQVLDQHPAKVAVAPPYWLPVAPRPDAALTRLAVRETAPKPSRPPRILFQSLQL